MSLPTMSRRLAVHERPSTPIVGRQRWTDLLFANWKVDAQKVLAMQPTGLFVDTFEGDAYVGVRPFFMQRVRPAWLPPMPWISWFLELNVRTYVHDANGQPGVWFYSLDCYQPLAVTIARRFFHLPYFHARRYVLFFSDPKGRLLEGRVYHAPYRVHTPLVSEVSPGPA